MKFVAKVKYKNGRFELHLLCGHRISLLYFNTRQEAHDYADAAQRDSK